MTRHCSCQSKEFIDQCIITEIIGIQGHIKFPVKVFVKKKNTTDDDNAKKKTKSEIHLARVIFYTWICRVKHPKRNKLYYIIIIQVVYCIIRREKFSRLKYFHLR